MLKSIAHRWQGPGSAWPRGLFAGGELGCWFDCNRDDAFADTARTTPAALGTAVAGLTGRSGAALHAAQATAGARPILARCPAGGKRNLLTWTGDLTNAAWTKTNMAVAANVDGSFTLTDTATSGYHGVAPIALPTGGLTYARTVEVKKGNARYVAVSINSSPTSNANTSIFDLDTGSWTQSGTANLAMAAVALPGGWWRLTIAAVSSAGTTSRFFIGISPAATGIGAALQYAGGTGTLLVRRPQAEPGTAATAWQLVTTVHDTTETGKTDLWHLWSDLGDDSLPVTLPSLGSSATVFYSVEGASVILPGQTIGAGAFAVLRGERTFACGAINRALTATETAVLTAYLNARRGA